jgi:putative endonuclease
MAQHNETGIKGELLALKYLEDKGYIIKEINWRWSHYEIDIIARHNNTLVFVEVKTRTSAHFGFPESHVNNKKQAHLARAAEEYMAIKALEMDVRFDIISIVLTDNEPQIEHFEDAFFPYDV